MATLRLGDTTPDFQAETTHGNISFYDYFADSWEVLFFHPADYTSLCPTELGATAKLKDEFAKRNVKVIALSVDPVDSHHGWVKDINETLNTDVEFPIIGDHDRKVSKLNDFIHPNASVSATVRSVLIIAPDKTIKLIITYPASTGRNFNEIFRVIDSLQLTAHYQVATPANWEHGDEVVITSAVKENEYPFKFPKGYKTIKTFLKLTPQPNL